ncbi:MAG: DotA/TraY family protein [Alphaproteobacteria bacterium]|nr:DotA/TraY family protein [Alphaproteobacteria bacterium]
MGMASSSISRFFGYTLFPRILPRLRNFDFRFTFIAYLIAQFFITLRMLPRSHPYALPQSFGTYGILGVLANVANHIEWNVRNIDRIIVFILFVTAVILLVLQIIGFFVFLLVQSAQAAPLDIPSLFTISTPTDDISYKLLHRIFGVPDFFFSGSPDPADAVNTPFQKATQALFKFYSLTVMMVGGLIILYFIFTVIGEAMYTGSPFGQRFATIYAPARLVIFLFLITPAAHGYSLGQFTVLATAKWGSALATNAWKTFNVDMGNALKEEEAHLVVKPNADDISPLVKFMKMSHICRAGYALYENRTNIRPYLIKEGEHIPMPTSVQAAVEFYESGNIAIFFTTEAYATDPAKKSLCGSLTMRVDNAESPIVQGIYNQYLTQVQAMWDDAGFRAYGDKFVVASQPQSAGSCPGGNISCSYTPEQCENSDGTPGPAPQTTSASWSSCDSLPPPELVTCFRDRYQRVFNTAIIDGISDTNLASDEFMNFDMEEEIIKKGWGGAGIWYHKIAQVNGDLINISFKVPQPRKTPELMTRVALARQATDHITGGSERFRVDNLEGAQLEEANLTSAERNIAHSLYEAHKYLFTDSLLDRFNLTGNPFMDLFNLVIGTQGLKSLQENRDVHPLAQLSAMGRSLIDKAVFNVIGSVALGFGGGFLIGQENAALGEAVAGVSGALMTLAMLGIGVGFLLFYIIPFLPFIYFFFAVGTWVSTVFEAMVAIPLWAIAHLRIDGNGLSGQAAANGYFMLLEIFLRPIIVVMGLVASMAIFSAMAVMFNDLFSDVTRNLSGFPVGYAPECISGTLADYGSMRSSADAFFFLLIYAFVLYMMAMSAFKLIDLMPDTIMRWLGTQVRSFGEIIANPPTDQLISYGAIGASQIAGEVGDVMKQGSQTLGGVVGGMTRGNRGNET